jgi:hypothetical protein
MNPQVQVGLIAFSAVIISAFITWVGNVCLQRSVRSWQKDQWLLDKKTAEYKEMLSTLAASVESMAHNSPDFGMTLPSLLTDEQQRLAYDTAVGEARKTITDRIFIFKQVQAAAILDLWQDLGGQRDLQSFWEKWAWLRRKIIETARDDLEIKGH